MKQMIVSGLASLAMLCGAAAAFSDDLDMMLIPPEVAEMQIIQTETELDFAYLEYLPADLGQVDPAARIVAESCCSRLHSGIAAKMTGLRAKSFDALHRRSRVPIAAV